MNLTPVATAVSVGFAFALGRLSRRAEVITARREANTDPLTGLANRSALERHLHDRTGRGQSYTLFLLDLDGFKPINDTHGHRAGDHLLRAVGARLRAALDPHLVARLGGDEFVVVVDGRHDHWAGLSVAGRILAAVGRPVSLPAAADPVTLRAAVGIAAAGPGAGWRAVLHTADLAMYRSKALGVPHQVAVGPSRAVRDSPRVRIRDVRPVSVPTCL